jgi:hypothetical protein
MKYRILLLAIVLAAGCKARPASLDVKPDNLLITKKGGTLQLQVIPKDKNGTPMSSSEITFKAMTPTMATVNSSGLVKAVQSGLATVLISVDGLDKEVEISLQIPQKIVIDPDNKWTMLGVTRGYTATVINDRGKPILAGGVRWTSSNPEIASVDKFGNVKTLTEGVTTITAYAAGIQGDTKLTVKHEEFNEEDGTLNVMNEAPDEDKKK